MSNQEVELADIEHDGSTESALGVAEGLAEVFAIKRLNKIAQQRGQRQDAHLPDAQVVGAAAGQCVSDAAAVQ